MKILYGVQGTGNGHITRARIMAKALQQANIEVDWVFSGRPANDYFDMECFGNYRTFRGLTFAINKGKVSPITTAKQANLLQLRRDIAALDLSPYDLVINDFEPITAWAAQKQKRFSIGVSHQNAFRYPIPKRGSNWFIDTFMRWFAPVSLPIGLHWHHFNQPILPPIIEHHRPSEPIEPTHVLVYFPFQSVEQLCYLLEPFSQYQFSIYHSVKTQEQRGHIRICPFSRDGFQQDLLKTSGVICGAGFELPSEAIQLGKKLLVQPVGGQMEQSSNALALQQLGLATVCDQLSHAVIEPWLNQTSGSKISFPDTASALVGWLRQGQWDGVKDLVRSLW